MRRDFLFDAWEDIDDKYIEEARTYEYVRKTINWKRVLSIAAAAVVTVGVGIGVYQIATSSPSPNHTTGNLPIRRP